MEETQDVSKKSVVIKYGTISGLVGIILFIIQDFAGIAGNQEYSWLSTIISVLIVGTFIFLAQKEYINGGDGFMSYGEGLGIGTLMSLVSGIISSIFTFIYISYVNPAFLDNIREQQVIAMEEQGMSDAQIDQAMKMAETFTSPIAMAIFGILWAVFIGFVVSLLVSAFTKKSRPEFE